MSIFTTFRIIPVIAALLPVPAQAERATFNFNPDWRLHVGEATGADQPQYDDSQWKPVTLPRAWNEDSAFRVSIEDLPTGIAWYRKSFVLPPDSAGKRVYIEFEGARQGAEFFINGTSLGFHEDGITAVGFDLTPYIRPAPSSNVISVRTDNSWDYRTHGTKDRFQWNDRNFNANYGGLPKNVRLHVTEPLHQTLPLIHNLGTTGVYVYPADFDLPAGRATIHAESEVRNDSDRPQTFEFVVTVAELDGTKLATFRAENPVTLAPGKTSVVKAAQRVSGLHWWSWGYGYLYNVTTRLVVAKNSIDSVTTRTGFRKTDFKSGMVGLNGRAIQIKGYAQRTSNEWPAIGASVPPWLSDFSNGLMVESGANLVRWMHITPWKQDVESCDRVGLMQAMPAGDAEGDVTGRRWEQRVEVMRASIIYNRNNPSIIFYEGGNNGISEEHMAELKAVRDQYDPHGGRAIGARNMLDSKVAEYGGEMLYINKSARIPFWQMEYSRDEGLRKYWDEFSPPFHKEGDGPSHKGEPAPDYNHNQDAHAIENVRRWYDFWEARPGTGERVNSGGVNIVFSDSNTHHRGELNYRTSGEVDAMRIPKDGFYAHQVMWDGWVDVEHPRAHIIGHWNYAPGTTKPVHVISSAPEVELFLNGRSLGRNRKPEYHFLFTFPAVKWEPGVIEAVGYGADGKEICRTKHETTGKPAKLRLTARVAPDGIGFKADGADLALLEIEVVDAEGRRVPTALNPVEFSIDGPAEWRGGIAQGPDNCILSKSLPVECGVNRALLRSTTAAGRIHVKATSPGLPPAELELTSVSLAKEVSSGVQSSLPDAGLPPSLVRGPTPKGPSFKPSRISVPVVSAKAGGNADKTALAYDDNETSTWSSGKGSGNAWIEFTLARPARLTEITAKLPGWRNHTYPISVSIDGKEVYRGTTPNSLGYVTLPLMPATGRVVRVQLIGKSDVKDGFGGITEVANAANTSDGPAVARGELGIVEIEFLEPDIAELNPSGNFPMKNHIQPSHFRASGGRRRILFAMAAGLLGGCGFARCEETKSVAPPAQDSFQIYLLMGQSNMAGRDTRELASQVVNPKVLAMTPDGQWVVAKDPIHQKDGRTEPGAGPGIPFANAMLKDNPKITIGLVPCAVGGSPLKRWVKNGDLYQRAMERAKLAAKSGKIAGVLWLQGETDSDKEPWATTYESRLSGMIQDLRSDLALPQLPVVVGQIGDFLTVEKHPYVETVRAAIKEVAGKTEHVGYADSNGLTDKGDSLHFDAKSVRELGKRFAVAMETLQSK